MDRDSLDLIEWSFVFVENEVNFAVLGGARTLSTSDHQDLFFVVQHVQTGVPVDG